MTIDERLDRLTADVQMLVQVSASNESNITRLHDSVQELRDLQAKNEQLMANMMTGINQIGRVVLLHEKRITDLEGGRA